MRVTVVAVGSRGDVQPYVALGEGLAQAGYHVRIGTHEPFARLLEGRGLEFQRVGDDPAEIFADPRIHSVLSSGTDTLRFIREFRALLDPVGRRLMEDAVTACEDSDAVVLSSAGIIPGFHQVAEALGVRYCSGLLQPLQPTRAFASPFVPPLPRWLPAKGLGNLATHYLFLRTFGWFFRHGIPMLREEHGLPPLSHLQIIRGEREADAPLLFGISPSVLPRPNDWPERAQMTGYWFLDAHEDWQPPDELRDFLDAGSPPVYIGFGSMVTHDPEAETAIVVEALQRTGQRGILLTGAGAFVEEGLPDEVLALHSAPHDWLFPHMSAVVHHGGAGTTSAGLRSGVPSIVVPFFADQPFWARTVHELGVGPRPIPHTRLTADRLAAAIEQAVGDEAMRERAASLGERIRAEDGVGRAVEIIRGHFGEA
jgi:UDP:flavonoid glycosyltransferase YjiC (YdhE family)